MTAAESVKRDITATGAMNVLGLCTSCVPQFITDAIKTIYAKAVTPLIIGFLLMDTMSIVFPPTLDKMTYLQIPKNSGTLKKRIRRR